MKITIYDLSTGKIKRTGFVPDADKDAQHGDGEGVLFNVDCNQATQRVDPETKEIMDIEIIPPTLAELKTAAKAKAAARRWEVETGGVNIGGMDVDTDDRSKMLLASAAEQARLDPQFTAKWKTAGGSWAPLDAETILAVYGAVFAHVRACFAREEQIDALVDAAADADDVAWLDATIAAFWP